MSKSIDELLEDYHIVKYDNIDGYTRFASSETDWYELKQAIYSALKAEMPKRKKIGYCETEWEHHGESNAVNSYNQALNDVHEILNNLFSEGE